MLKACILYKSTICLYFIHNIYIYIYIYIRVQYIYVLMTYSKYCIIQNIHYIL